MRASPATKGALRKLNILTEFVPSDPENTDALERYLSELVEEDVDLETLERELTRSEPAAGAQLKQTPPVEDRVVLWKRWLEEIALDNITVKRA